MNDAEGRREGSQAARGVTAGGVLLFQVLEHSKNLV